MGVLGRLVIALLFAFPWQALAFTLTCDNGTDHRYYEIVGAPWGRVRVESSGSRKGVRYQYTRALPTPSLGRCGDGARRSGSGEITPRRSLYRTPAMQHSMTVMCISILAMRQGTM